MSDRELLEMAAKAAGYRLEWHIPRAGSDEPHIEGIDWNPLTDDGDALRLAVKLRIDLLHAFDTRTAMAENTSGYAAEGQDPCAATRRAIVRAAAEIGRETK
jgi:hypothetical protein